jgi:hypothetical protein
VRVIRVFKSQKLEDECIDRVFTCDTRSLTRWTSTSDAPEKEASDQTKILTNGITGHYNVGYLGVAQHTPSSSRRRVVAAKYWATEKADRLIP